jgi:serine/threonine-protein kinase
MDFGIARALASGATTMTQTSAVIGTAQYLSPEQARGEAVDARSDVYAAGCVLFELLVGHPPFVGDSPVSVAYQHVREDPKAPSDVNPEVPRDVDAIVLKALAKNPVNRYQSAQEMRADALRAVSGRPVLATPVMSQAETMAMQGQPTRQWQPQAATTMQRPVPGGMPPRPPERRSSWVMAALAGLGVLVVVVLGVALAMSRNNDKTGNDNQQQTVTVAMPSLVGKTDEDARAALQQAKLTNVQPETPTTGADCKGTVIKQDPLPNVKIPVDQEVSYQLCLAPDKVPVPNNLVGSTKDNAEQVLTGLGLDPEFQEVSSAQPLNTVTDVEHAGDKVDPNSKITVKISKANKVKMPKVTGVSEETAKALLDQVGSFNVTTNTVPATDPSQVPGTVIDQNPKQGTTVEKGDKVTITVVADDQTDPSGDPSPTDTATPDGGSGGGQVTDQALAIIRSDD